MVLLIVAVVIVRCHVDGLGRENSRVPLLASHAPRLGTIASLNFFIRCGGSELQVGALVLRHVLGAHHHVVTLAV